MIPQTALLPAHVTERVYDELLTLRAEGGERQGSPEAERALLAFPAAPRAAQIDLAICGLRGRLRGVPSFERAERLRAVLAEIMNPQPFDEGAIRAAATAALARHERERRAPSRRRARP
jgi:hypothetical protein